jgi:hypothetical protein
MLLKTKVRLPEELDQAHDVIDIKGLILGYPTILLKLKGLAVRV